MSLQRKRRRRKKEPNEKERNSSTGQINKFPSRMNMPSRLLNGLAAVDAGMQMPTKQGALLAIIAIRNVLVHRRDWASALDLNK